MIHGIVITMDPQRRILADGAVAVENGRIAEQGDFETLMARKGYFYSLFTVNQ